MKPELLQKPIGLLGGTFDPIHFGHLRAAEDVYKELRLAKLFFLPAGKPVLRSQPSASPLHRLAMVKLAIKEHPEFAIKDREIHSKEVSYTVNTLQFLRDELGNTPLCFVLGADAFENIEQWHEWKKLFLLAHMIVLQRPGFPLLNIQNIPAWAKERWCDDVDALHRVNSGLITPCSIRENDVSATVIRSNIQQGKSIEDLVPQSVAGYIAKHRLYQS